MYEELVKALHYCGSEDRCKGCPRENAKTKCYDDICIEAADAIEEIQGKYFLMKKTAEWLAEKVPRWIPVTEQLIHSGWYLVACNEWGGSAVRKAIYDEATSKWLEFPCGGPKNITKFVTYYMPLPQPPEGEEA